MVVLPPARTPADSCAERRGFSARVHVAIPLAVPALHGTRNAHTCRQLGRNEVSISALTASHLRAIHVTGVYTFSHNST